MGLWNALKKTLGFKAQRTTYIKRNVQYWEAVEARKQAREQENQVVQRVKHLDGTAPRKRSKLKLAEIATLIFQEAPHKVFKCDEIRRAVGSVRGKRQPHGSMMWLLNDLTKKGKIERVMRGHYRFKDEAKKTD